MTKITNKYLEEPPMEINGKIVAKDLSLIQHDQCIECKQKYDTSHKERQVTCLWVDLLSGSVMKVYSAKSGYCPECIKNHWNPQENHEQLAWTKSVHKCGVEVHHGSVFDVYSDGAKLERIH